MKKAHRNFQIKPWMGCMGFLGFLGFLPKHGGGRNYLFFVFFAFFAWFFWGLLYKELSFLLLFLLDRRGIGRDTVLLFGALGYSVCSVAAPALTYYLDRKA